MGLLISFHAVRRDVYRDASQPLCPCSSGGGHMGATVFSRNMMLTVTDHTSGRCGPWIRPPNAGKLTLLHCWHPHQHCLGYVGHLGPRIHFLFFFYFLLDLYSIKCLYPVWINPSVTLAASLPFRLCCIKFYGSFNTIDTQWPQWPGATGLLIDWHRISSL